MEAGDVHLCVAAALVASMVLACVALSRDNPAPYGRYYATKSLGLAWGAHVPAKVAWVVQESPSLAVPAYLMATTANRSLPRANAVLLALFIAHYVNRVLVYPLRIRGGKPTPLFVALAAFAFCCTNGWLQAWYLLNVPLEDPGLRFVAGCAVFLAGAAINVDSDSRLRALRKEATTSGGYAIPRGGLFDLVSGANFFGECVEWAGFAVAQHRFPGYAFAACCALNLAPRALQHHAWYHAKFKGEYPPRRRAFIPFVL